MYLARIKEAPSAINIFFQTVIEIRIEASKVEFMYAYTNLADTFGGKDLYDKAKKALESYLDNFADRTKVHHALSTLFSCWACNVFCKEEAGWVTWAQFSKV
jgi:hypothetical protein